MACLLGVLFVAFLVTFSMSELVVEKEVRGDSDIQGNIYVGLNDSDYTEEREGDQEEEIYDVAIVGGGLSGLVLMNDLHSKYNKENDSNKKGIVLLEASTRFGGRLMNTPTGLDLGAAWVWPQAGQPNVESLLLELSMETFDQPGDSPAGTRITGGAYAFIENLINNIKKHTKMKVDMSSCESPLQLDWYLEQVRLVTRASSISSNADTNDNSGNDNGKDSKRKDKEIEVVQLTAMQRDTESSPRTILARHVILAIPPRLLATSVTFSPPLPTHKLQAMLQAYTWMAGVSKVVIEYPFKFWPAEMDPLVNTGLKYQGTSGSSSSSRGKGNRNRGTAAPAFQVYDGSTEDYDRVAITFFTLPPPDGSLDDNQKLAQACVQQLAEIWIDNEIPEPILNRLVNKTGAVTVQRWPLSSISDDFAPTTIRPHPKINRVLREPIWNGKVLFAGSESDQYSPGVMEGAISSAKAARQDLEYIISREKEGR